MITAMCLLLRAKYLPCALFKIYACFILCNMLIHLSNIWIFLNMSNMDLVFSLLVHINYLSCTLLVLLNIFSCYYFMMMNSSYVLVEVIEELILWIYIVGKSL
jgi:hypothetical protein